MSAFEVRTWMHVVGGLVERHPAAMVRLANLETRALAERLEELPPAAPIYVSGLARSGTTILLEAIARHPDVATHRYRDYPLVLLPYAWPWLLRFAETRRVAAVERAHGDRILVTPHSPEAMEEVVWRTFFPKPGVFGPGDTLGPEVANPDFERFYRAHVGKVLLAQRARRYLAKGNYNITRLGYIRAIFPAATFVVPVRAPEGHIASLMRQHRRFTEHVGDNARGQAHLRRVGHFEFGPLRRPIDTGAPGVADSIARLWQAGEEVRGWARQWAAVYGHALDLLERVPGLGPSALLVRYEDFCARPREVLAQVFGHVGLSPDAALIDEFSREVSAPDYYDSRFAAADRAAIREETDAVARRLGYPAA
jgi:hypothetical protein